MKLSEVASRDAIVVPLDADDVGGAVEVLGRRLVEASAVEVIDAITGSDADGPIYRQPGEGVLVAHRGDPRVRRLAVAIGVAPEPLKVPRDADAAPPRVVVVVAASADSAALHRRAVDALARGLQEGKITRRLLSAAEPDDVVAIRELMDLVLDEPIVASHAMSERAFRVYPTTPISEIVDLMVRHSLTGVPVVGEKQEVLGIVTVKDVLRHLLPRRRAEERDRSAGVEAPEGVGTAKDIMTRTVMCVSEDQNLVDVANLLLNKDVDQIPVVKEGVLTGFLGEIDILRRLFGR